jgi:hypothetical protein
MEVDVQLWRINRSRWNRRGWSRFKNTYSSNSRNCKYRWRRWRFWCYSTTGGGPGGAGGSGIVIVKELNKASGSWPLSAQFRSTETRNVAEASI